MTDGSAAGKLRVSSTQTSQEALLMETIARVATALQTVLGPTAEATARATEFVKRRRKLGGAPWVQTLVFGWLANPEASLGELSQTAASLGIAITPQGLDQRFTPEAAACLEAVLAASLTEVVMADPVAVPLLARFPAVYIQDTTTITLPDALAGAWRGCDGGTTTDTAATGTAAAVKAQVRLDLCQGTLHGPLLEDGRTADQRLAPSAAEAPVGSVLVQDLGYFAVATLAEADAAGRFWVTRLKVQTAIYEASGRRWEVGALLAARAETALDLPVRLGARERLACRLLAVRVPPTVAAERRRKLKRAARAKGRKVSAARLAVADWTVLVTNLPVAMLSVAEALVLYRARWQIELLFKRWKAQGKVATWRSAKPWRILCEVYAKLLGLVVQHWLLRTGAWSQLDRSLWKAAQTIRQHAAHLASVFAHRDRLTEALATIAFCLTTGCRLDTRRTRPSTAQLLANPSRACLA
jgi:hypothetical protein